MTAQELHDHLLSKADAVFANALLNSQVEGDFPCFVIKKDSLSEVMTFLKENAECSFGFLTTLCAMHFPEQEEKEFGMVYHLHNLPNNWRIRIKCFFPKSDLKVASLVSIWPTANWMERQEYDFFGIQFQGHPNLKRILNMDEMNYFPMRKEYGLEDASRDDKEDKYFGR
ncbi:MAG: NADH-quinone oxidoreductase subunit C [Bacteroidota bacterium]|jgi:NADH-quinone oxidoreductase subunit C